MHRFTARLLLVLALVGTLVPVALAISAPAPHACCVRKAMHHPELHATAVSELHSMGASCEHDCCRAVTGVRAASLKPFVTSAAQCSLLLPLPDGALVDSTGTRWAHLVRGPPQLSIV